MDDRVCGLLTEVDNLFTKGAVNERKFNKLTQYHSYCPYENNSNKPKCTTNNDRISALSAYLHDKISEIDKAFKNGANSDKRHIKIFIIWLGDKLFKMENDYKSTLEESYRKNLEKSMGSVNYWKVVDSRKLYKKATIKKMNEFYNLLNYICKLIIEYNKNLQKPNKSRLVNYYTQCDNYYKTIHNSINGCKPYLQLLDDLKMIYEVFRLQKIDIYSKLSSKDKDSLLKRIKHLTTFKNENKYFVTVNERYSFDDKECLESKSKDEQIGEKIASQKSKNPIGGPQTRVSGSTQHRNTGYRNPASLQPKRPPVQSTLKSPSEQSKFTKPIAVKPAPPPQSLPSTPSETDTKLKAREAGKTHQNGPGNTVNGVDGGKGDAGSGSNGGHSVQGDKRSKSDASDGGLGSSSKTQTGSDIGTGSPGGEPGGTAGGKEGKSGEKGDTSGGLGDGSGGTGTEKKDINSGLGSHEDSSTQVGKDGGQKSSNSDTRDPVNVPGSGVHGSEGGGVRLADQLVKDTQQGIGDGKSEQGSKSSGATDGQGSQRITSSGSGGANGSKIGQKIPDSGKGNKDGGANGGAGTSGSGANRGGSTKSDQGNPSVGSNDQGNPSDGSTDQGDKSGGPRDPASSTSGGSFGLGPSFLEYILKGTNKLNKASEFIQKNQQNVKEVTDKISNVYKNTMDNLKSAYDKSSSYLSEFINNVTSQLNQADPPKSGGNHSGPGSPTDGGNSSNQLQSPQPPTPKDPIPTTPPTTSIDPASPKQPSPQTQSITPQTPQVNHPNHKAIGQLVKSLSSDIILKNPWNIFPTTWNGSGDCKPEIKFMSATLVCCTSEQCNLTGISVTLVLIPIILLIVYKYLSFGLSKKSEKKNMKKVINLHDGNRKTKIIISSYDNKKDLKPVINSVGEKKYSLLNIYKLMQADPIPFINLFFLLIFFVYKRKRDTIE
ncbi:PIR protein CIR protein [Plasmodium vinckei vinckei]|uniref:PIR protein CIR protein n=1 Tax=Plasmodium vinckei vinckei TaxID=54757 RepID=A0A449BNT0_PLAVN|nr:PIR protein CIR protein [Plasmodium vinckei vinckei]VEV55100.1 PIR protein CIR protein [Plasmodium vinckei vinckei]